MKKFFFFIACIALIPFGAYAEEGALCTTSPLCTCSTSGEDGVVNFTSIGDADACNDQCVALDYGSYAFQCNGVPEAAGEVTTTVLQDVSQAYDDVKGSYIPSLNVPIPGLDLKNSVTVDDEGNVTSSMLGLYINAVFSYALAIGAIIGIFMLSIAGLQYMTAGGSKKAVTAAKDRIQNTIIGLILLMACYAITFLIDPRTTRFNPLTLENVAAVEYFPPDGEDVEGIVPNLSLNGATQPVTGNGIILKTSNAGLDPDALIALQTAAKSFFDTYGIAVVVTSATRDLEKQATLFFQNCLANGGRCAPSTCNPANSSVVAKTGSRYVLTGSLADVTDKTTIISGMVQNASYGNCPHTSAVAVDIWCNDGGGNYRHDPACQDLLIKTMTNNGFCRLTSEPWHFELDSKKVSQRSCSISNNSVSYTSNGTPFAPPSTCALWDFKYHSCIKQR